MTLLVEFEVETPVDCSEDEAEEWVRFCLGERGSMSADNPLAGYDIEADSVYVR